jgi:hypothetical protein
MADNQFSVAVPNILQALMAGEQGYKDVRGYIQQNQQDRARQQAAQALQSGGDTRGAFAQLIGTGDFQAANAVSSMDNNQFDRQFRQTEAQRAQGNTDRSFGLQERQVGQHASESARDFQFRQEEARRAQTNADRSFGFQEKQAATAQEAPMIVPFGSGIINKRGETIREPSGEASLDPETLTFMAKQYMAGDTSVLTNLGRGAQGAQNVVALRKRIAELNTESGQGGAEQANRNFEAFGAKAGQRTLGTRSANIELAATEFEQVLPVVQAASQAVSRTNYPNLNAVMQAWQKGSGDKNVVAFAGGVNTLVNLYARAISPSGTPTVSDKDHAREILDKAWSQGQFDAAVGMMRQEIRAALNSPGKVRDDMRARFLGGQPGAEQPSASASAAPGVPAPPPGFQLVK